MKAMLSMTSAAEPRESITMPCYNHLLDEGWHSNLMQSSHNSSCCTVFKK